MAGEGPARTLCCSISRPFLPPVDPHPAGVSPRSSDPGINRARGIPGPTGSGSPQGRAARRGSGLGRLSAPHHAGVSGARSESPPLPPAALSVAHSIALIPAAKCTAGLAGPADRGGGRGPEPAPAASGRDSQLRGVEGGGPVLSAGACSLHAGWWLEESLFWGPGGGGAGPLLLAPTSSPGRCERPGENELASFLGAGRPGAARAPGLTPSATGRKGVRSPGTERGWPAPRSGSWNPCPRMREGGAVGCSLARPAVVPRSRWASEGPCPSPPPACREG